MSTGSVPTRPSGHVDRDDLVRAIATSLAGEEGALLLILHDVQNTFGYIDGSFVPTIADVLNLSRADVHGVISFYADFRSNPPGRTVVRVCRAEACQSVGAHALGAHARERLGVGFGETTADGMTTLDQVFCFGNCALGPTIEVNGLLYGRVDPDRFDALVDGATS
jgi:formate dehydrogenase subunit gamma